MSDDVLDGDDLSYDELVYQEPTPAAGSFLTGLVVLIVAVLGAPQVWDVLSSGDFGPAVVFYPVLGGAFAYLALRRRTR